MTRKEAIRLLSGLMFKGKLKEALDMAIKALEQEPTTKNNLGVDCRSLEDIKKLVERKADVLDGVMLDAGGVIIGLYFAIANDLTPVTPQEPKIKVLDNDEVARKLGTVDIYKASAWITLLKDLEYLGMKICEVEE